MKTKLTVKISINTKSKQPIVTADLLLPKTNWQPGMGLKHTTLHLNPEDRLSVDEVENIGYERPKFKVYANKDLFLECDAEAFKKTNSGPVSYWINVKFTEKIKRTYFFDPDQLGKIVYEKYPFEFTEKTTDDEKTVTLPIEVKPAPTKK